MDEYAEKYKLLDIPKFLADDDVKLYVSEAPQTIALSLTGLPLMLNNRRMTVNNESGHLLLLGDPQYAYRPTSFLGKCQYGPEVIILERVTSDSEVVDD